MSEASLEHYGIKGMRWGHRNNFSFSGSRSIKVAGPSVTVGPKGSKGPKAPPQPARTAGPRTVATKTAPRAAAPRAVAPQRVAPAPQRSFAPAHAAPAPPRHFSTTEGRRVRDHDSKLTPEQRAHRRKVILGTTAVVGILGVAAAGTAAYKLSPPALAAMKNLNAASQNKVTALLAHPKAVNLKLQGGRTVNKVKLHAALRQGIVAERFKRTPQGMVLNKGVNVAKGNRRVARVAIKQDLSVLRRETESMRVMNDAEKYVANIIKRNSAKSFRLNNSAKSFKLVGEAVARR